MMMVNEKGEVTLKPLSESCVKTLAPHKFENGTLKSDENSEQLFDAFNREGSWHNGNEPDLCIYGERPSFEDYDGKEKKRYEIPDMYGIDRPLKDTVLEEDDSYDGFSLPSETVVSKIERTKLKIAYSISGNKGPIVIMLHGVPMSRKEKITLVRRMHRHCRIAIVDILGMGDSSMPLSFRWSWEMHAHYVPGLVDHIIKNHFNSDSESKTTGQEQEQKQKQKVFLQGSDWAGGIVAKVLESDFGRERLHAGMFVNPVAFSAYPINEIQAVGQTSRLSYDAFNKQMGGFPSSLVQIEKSMIRQYGITNQWVQRHDIAPYMHMDYERNTSSDVKGTSDLKKLAKLMDIHTDKVFTSLSALPKMWNMRCLAEQSAYLRPAALQPYHSTKNPQGVMYTRYKVPVLISTSSHDKMMSAGNRYFFKYAIQNAPVQVHNIPDSDHFASKDAPSDLATKYLTYIEEILGIGSLAQPFLGLDGIWKGDEKERLEALKELYYK